MKITDFFRKKSSSEVAKDRLKFLLVSDGLCSPEVMELIKNDIIEVISKRLEIDAQGLEIQLTETETEDNGRAPTICANIPIKSIRRKYKRIYYVGK